jgi:hypothetical protein
MWSDFLTKCVASFGKETRGEYDMKQCPNCGDICTRGNMKRDIEYAVHVAGKSLSGCELDRRALSLGEAERDKVIMHLSMRTEYSKKNHSQERRRQ